MKGYPIILFVMVSVYFIIFITFNANSLYSYDYKPYCSIMLVTIILVLSLLYSIVLYVKEKANDRENNKDENSKES